ncbi:MAG: hypothetical protein V3V08_07215 [Nannocystaceae bacterium]
MSATAKQITITSVVSAVTLIGLLFGGWMFFDGYFAHAEDVTDVMNVQSVVINETINENKLEDKRAQLEVLRARRRAGYTYPEDADTEARLLDDIRRAQDYDDKLQVLKTQIK